MTKKILILAMAMSGCGFRDLPKEEPKKSVAAEEPQKGIFDTVTQKQTPDDPNRTLPESKVVANPDIVGFPTRPMPTNSRGGNPAGSSSTANEVKKSLDISLHWDQILAKYKMVDENRAAERLKEVIALEGDKGAEKVEVWRKSHALTEVIRGDIVKIQINPANELTINFTAYLRTPNVDAKALVRVSALNFSSAKALKWEDLKSEVELIPQAKSSIGKVTVRSLSAQNEFLFKISREDGQGLAFVAAIDPQNFADIAIIKQFIGYENVLEESVVMNNLLSFVQIGRNKVLSQLKPLSEAILKMDALAEKNKRLTEVGATEYFVKLAQMAFGSDPKDKSNLGVLGQLTSFTEASYERIVTIRSDELDEEKPPYMNDSDSVPSVNKTIALKTVDYFVKRVADAKAEMTKLANQDKSVDAKEIIETAGNLKIDMDTLSEGFDFMAKEIKYKETKN